jgi:hypothetical protein
MLLLTCSQPVGLLVTISFSSSRVSVTRCPHSDLDGKPGELVGGGVLGGARGLAGESPGMTSTTALPIPCLPASP